MVSAGMTAFEARAPFVTKLVAGAEQNRSGMIASLEGREANLDIAGAREFIVHHLEELERLRRHAEAAARDELQLEVAREELPVAAAIDADLVAHRALDADPHRATEAGLDLT